MPSWFSSSPRKPRPRALTAAGVRVTPANAPSIGARRAGEWQKLAWSYRTLVPELRYVGGFVATQLSRVRWFIAEAGPEGHEPRPLTGEPPDGDSEDDEPQVSLATQRAAIDALERLDLNSRGSSMAGRGAENFEYAGECYLLGEQNPDTGLEEWTIRSVSEVRISSTAELCQACGQRHPTIRLVEPGTPTNNQEAGRVVLYCQAELFRLWNPDPEYHEWADAKITACLGVLAEIVYYDRQARAAAKSRIGPGSFLYVPEELSLQGQDPDADEDMFMTELIASMTTPVSDDDDPSAIVPIVIRGPALFGDSQAYKDLIGSVPIPREDIKDSVAKREAAVTKLAHGMDVPPEIITGVTEANHWSAFAISDAVVKNHVEPRAENFADSLTAAYLRVSLLAQGCPADEVARVCVWFDASELAQPADPMVTAAKLHEADILSDEAFARAGGYGEGDLASETEKLYRALSKGRITPEAVRILVALAKANSDDPSLNAAANIAEQIASGGATPPAQSADRIIDYGNAGPTPMPSPAVAAKTPAALAQAQGAVPATAQGATPDSPRVSVTAAAPLKPVSHYKVDEHLCRELADVDTRLIAELGGFIDAAILDIVRQAANRIRSGALRASAGPEERAMFTPGCDPVAVVAAGRFFNWTITDRQALEGALDRIRPRWLSSVSRAARKIADILSRFFPSVTVNDVQNVLEQRATEAWPSLAEKIEKAAVDRLHGANEDGTVDDGPLLPRSDITEALTEVGGAGEAAVTGTGPTETPSTGLGAGSVVQEAVKEAGGAPLGYLWRYEGHPRTPFPPHKALSGERYTGYTDPKLVPPPGYEWVGPFLHQGDHEGCGCSAELVVATPREPDPSPSMIPDAGFDEQDTPEQARIRALAEADDRAGRRGTLPDGRTYAQRDRDLIDELRRLRREHIIDRTVKGQAISS